MITACKSCGHENDNDVLVLGYCPGCADDVICEQCRRECGNRICDDCLEAERDATGAYCRGGLARCDRCVLPGLRRLAARRHSGERLLPRLCRRLSVRAVPAAV
jgi:hypothetical protein